MQSNLILAGIIVLYMVIGFVAAETNLSGVDVAPATEVPQAPDENAPWYEKMSAALAPIGWAFKAVGGLFALATYQSENVPPLVNSLIFLPLGLVVIIWGIRLIRGS